MRHVDISLYDRSHHPLIAYRERFRLAMVNWWYDDEDDAGKMIHEIWKTMQCRFHKVGSFLIAQFHAKGPAEPIRSILSLMNFRAEMAVFGTEYSCVVAKRGRMNHWTQWDAWADAYSYINFMIAHGHHLPVSMRREKKVNVYWNRKQAEKHWKPRRR